MNGSDVRLYQILAGFSIKNVADSNKNVLKEISKIF